MHMLSKFILSISAALLVSPSALAKKSKLGDFEITREKDPFTKSETYIATLHKGAQGLSLRCIEGDATLLLHTFSIKEIKMGDRVKIETKVDENWPGLLFGTVVGYNEFVTLIEFGDHLLMRELTNGDQLALRIRFADNIGMTTVFTSKYFKRASYAALEACD